ncbi:MAG: hypothetical protein KKH75_03595, partial [Actinobacteria bacterium]|nr:hypothetical protein [Actinomycetota bacterium]
MIRTAVSRPVRVGVAMVGVAGALTLAGCSAGTTAESAATTETPASTAATAPTTGATSSAADASSTTYANGTYTASGSYQTPESVEQVSVTVTLADDVVTAVEVNGTPTTSESKQYQSRFIGGISSEVVGKDIDQISVSRVAGSSLTSGGFNQAIEEIKSEAKA